MALQVGLIDGKKTSQNRQNHEDILYLAAQSAFLYFIERLKRSEIY